MAFVSTTLPYNGTFGRPQYLEQMAWTVKAKRLLDCMDAQDSDPEKASEYIMAAHNEPYEEAPEWIGMLDAVASLRKLRFLQIDVSNCYCPVGCHRMIAWACYWLKEADFPFPASLEIIEILGTKTYVERKRIISALIEGILCQDCRPTVRFIAEPQGRLYRDEDDGMEDEVITLGRWLSCEGQGYRPDIVLPD
jgi:hypothetical protein